MPFLHEFPYTDFHEINLDWIIWKFKQLEARMNLIEAEWGEVKILIENTIKKIGNLDDLLTINKNTIVDAINETYQMCVDLQNDIANLDTIVMQHTNDINNLRTSINMLQTSITSLESQMLALSNKVAGFNDRITDAENSITSLLTKLSDVETSISNILSDIQKIYADLNNKVDWHTNGCLGAKNLIPEPYLNSTYDGITYSSPGNGTIEVSGTTTSSSSGSRTFATLDLTDSKSGISIGDELIASVESNNPNTLGISVGCYNSNIELLGIFYLTDSIKFTVPNDTVYMNFGINYEPGITLNEVIKPMLRFAKDTDDTWRPSCDTNLELTYKVRQLMNSSGGSKIETVWTNPNPSANFAEQDVLCDLSDAKFVIVFYITGGAFPARIAFIGLPRLYINTQRFGRIASGNNNQLAYMDRQTFVNSDRITFSQATFGYVTSLTNIAISQTNAWMIPTEIVKIS